jgi:hypothetical protein
MQEPRAFCRAVMHEYEAQWSRATGHGVRHPLRLKMERLKTWCDDTCTAADFQARLTEARTSEDAGTALLAEELLALWQAVTPGNDPPSFTHT